MRNRKEICLIAFMAAILLVIAAFSIWNWDAILHIFYEMFTGVAIVKEYILSLGIVGFLAITLIIILCFFFPFISSIPVQLASAVSYGLPFGILHVTLSIFLASQMVFLFARVFRSFQSPRRRKKQDELEQQIRNSSRSITVFLLLAYMIPFVPFLLIHTVAASSGMKWRKYSLFTLLGPVPNTVITLWLGNKLTTSFSPLASMLILLFVLVFVLLSVIYKEKIINWVFCPPKKGEKRNGE